MIAYVAILALQVYCIVDVIRRGRSSLWIMALVFLPIASALAYFVVEILPGLQGNRHVRVARQKLVEKLDPERELRAAAGLTQAELARRTGIHRPNIARVEAGRHTPSLETLARLASAIGVPTTTVLAEE